MINLLPEEQTAAIRSEYRRRRVMVFGMFALAWFLVLVLTVFAFYILARSRHQTTAGQLATREKELAGTEAGLINAELVRLAGDLKILKEGERARVLPLNYLQKVLSAKPVGVKINSILFVKSALEESTIELAGVTETRRALLSFLEQLRSDETFAAVDSPVSNLIKENNADFNLKLRLNKPL